MIRRVRAESSVSGGLRSACGPVPQALAILLAGGAIFLWAAGLGPVFLFFSMVLVGAALLLTACRSRRIRIRTRVALAGVGGLLLVASLAPGLDLLTGLTQLT